MRRLFLTGGALVLALLGSYGILSAGKAFPGLATSTPGARGLPGQWLLENVRLRAYEGDRQTVDARVSSLEIGPARAGLFTLPTLRQARMRELDATLVGVAGRPTRVRADRAKADWFRRAWILEGNVRVEGPGARLACAKLRWDPARGFLSPPDARMSCLKTGRKIVDFGSRRAEVRSVSLASPRPRPASDPPPR